MTTGTQHPEREGAPRPDLRSLSGQARALLGACARADPPGSRAPVLPAYRPPPRSDPCYVAVRADVLAALCERLRALEDGVRAWADAERNLGHIRTDDEWAAATAAETAAWSRLHALLETGRGDGDSPT